MSEAKRRGSREERIAQAKKRLTDLPGLTASGVRILEHANAILAIVDKSELGEIIARKLGELAPHMLNSFTATYEQWKALDHLPYFVSFGIAERRDGTYSHADLKTLTEDVVPLMLARGRGQELLTAVIPGVAPEVQPTVLDAVGKVEASIEEHALTSKVIQPSDAKLHDLFAADVAKLSSWADHVPGTPATGRRFLQEPLYEYLSDGWLRISVQYLDGLKAAACVPPTHWHYQGKLPQGITTRSIS